jgi:anti-anti-sigma factor
VEATVEAIRVDGAAGSSDTPVVEVIVREELGTHAVVRLNTLLREVLSLRPDRLVIDLAQCPFINAAAVEVLLDAHREAWRNGVQLSLRSPSPRVQRILRLARADRVLLHAPAAAGPALSDGVCG